MEQRFTEQAAKLSQEQIAALLGIQEKYLDLEKRHLARIAELEQQVEWFKRQLFGRRSERRILAGGDIRQLSLG